MNYINSAYAYAKQPAIITALSTGIHYATKFVSLSLQPFTATYQAAALFTGVTALAVKYSKEFFSNQNKDIVNVSTTAATLAALTILNNKFITNYLPALGNVTPQGAAAIGALVLAGTYFGAGVKYVQSFSPSKDASKTNSNNILNTDVVTSSSSSSN